jgi:hypothetical protein
MEWPSLRGLVLLFTWVFRDGIYFYPLGKALRMAENKISLTQLTYLSPLLSLILIHFILGEILPISLFWGCFGDRGHLYNQ